MNGKHAYLIMAHEYTEVLETLLALLDDSRNDIFLHIDKRVKEPIPPYAGSIIRQASFYPFKEVKVKWGSTLLKGEFAIVRKALAKGPYQYYHLLSAQDLPIKDQDQIHSFFEANQGKEFVHFGTEGYQKDIRSRYDYYHFFEAQLGRTRSDPFWNKAETYSHAIQRRLKVDRAVRCPFRFYGGSNWFSITQPLAEYFVSRYQRDKRYYDFTQCNDEFFLQTIVMDSPFREKLCLPGFLDDYRAIVRMIDWKRGMPYVFQEADFEELMSSDAMFARKFDEKRDIGIVRKIREALS